MRIRVREFSRTGSQPSFPDVSPSTRLQHSTLQSSQPDVEQPEKRIDANLPMRGSADILAVQRTMGNQVSQQRLAKQRGQQPTPDRVRRTIGDGHDLKSPRFAGDQTLEACFDDKARLTQGAQGDAVTAVQQALIDLGGELGPKGADGNYGPATANAVKKFKADEHLGFETIGDVGPGTMKRLDELFPGAAPTPANTGDDFGDEGEQSCPVDDEIVTAIQAQPALAEAAQERVSLTSAPAGGLVTAPGGSGHVSVPDAIARFKSKVNVSGISDDLNVSAKGQFFWSRQFAIETDQELTLMASEPTALPFVAKARVAFNTIMANKDASALIAELQGIARTSTSPEKPNMLRLVKNNRLSGGALEASLWSALNNDPTNKLPNIFRFLSLPTLQTLRRFDKVGCGTHALTVAARLKQKGGLTARDPKARQFSQSLVAGGLTRDLRPMGQPSSAFPPGSDSAAKATGKFLLGDVFHQQGAGAVVKLMRDALDGGLVIHARVMSGVGAGSTVVAPKPGFKPVVLGIPPPEEHSLLIIAYDLSDNSFVFSDPDAGVSHSPAGGAGFGTLFFDPSDGGRLSTARRPGEMPVEEDGKHGRGEKRYQVISLTTVN